MCVNCDISKYPVFRVLFSTKIREGERGREEERREGRRWEREREGDRRGGERKIGETEGGRSREGEREGETVNCHKFLSANYNLM